MKRDLVKNSLDAISLRRGLKMFPLFIVIVFITDRPSPYSLLPLVAIISVPFVIYCIKYFSLFKNAENYKVYYGEFSEPLHSGWHKNRCAFNVSFTTDRGKTVTKRTPYMWEGGRYIITFRLSKKRGRFQCDDYAERMVRILYNEMTDKMLVLGDDKLEKNSQPRG